MRLYCLVTWCEENLQLDFTFPLPLSNDNTDIPKQIEICTYALQLNVETGLWYNINKQHIMGTKCSEELIGDEFHYLFVCSNTEIAILKVRYISKY